MFANLKLDAETEGLLQSYGFDRELFESLRTRLRVGEMSARANRLSGPLQPPLGSEIRPLPTLGSSDREHLAKRGLEALRAGQVGCVILAGGMATRFGGVVKAAVDALPGHSFLSLKLADARRAARDAGSSVPVYLMSSFATHAPLVAMAAAAHSQDVPIEVFPQFISLRLTEDASLFLGDDGKASPYAPGHGDLSFALRRSGALTRFRERGGRLLMVSNVDNLAATLDPAVIGAHLEAKAEMSVEIGRRTPGERGGLPARLGGKLQIVEDFRLPEDFDVASVPYFNTNTFVFDAGALDRDYALTWFAVRKRVDGRDAIQFEHLVGQLSEFLSCVCLEVQRDGLDGRFQPVKDPEELALRRPEMERLLRARGVI